MRFFKGVAEYAVLLFDPQAGKMAEARLRSPEVRMALQVFGSSSRTPSPKKRPRDQSVDDYDFLVEDQDDDDVSVASDWEPPRGRRRKRSWEFFDDDTPPELVQSFVSTESDRSESQDVAERTNVEVRHHHSHYTAPEDVARDEVVKRPKKRVDMRPTRDDS